MRSISSAASSGAWAGTTMEARSRGSLSSQCSVIQSFTAEQIAAPIVSLTAIWPPYSVLQMATLMLNGSSAWPRIASRLVPALPFAGRQSARAVIGALGG
jgi:hypothetical protein